MFNLIRKRFEGAQRDGFFWRVSRSSVVLCLARDDDLRVSFRAKSATSYFVSVVEWENGKMGEWESG